MIQRFLKILKMQNLILTKQRKRDILRVEYLIISHG